MRVPVTPRRRQPEPPRESFVLKTFLVASALFLSAFVMVELEFYVSAPAHSLTETEVTMRAAAN